VNKSNGPSAADIADRHRRYLALAMLAVALLYAANAATHLVGPEMARVLEIAQVVMAVLAAAAILPMMLWKIRNRSAGLRQLYLSEEGYVAETFHRAKNVSWVTTFILLSGLVTAASRFESVPAEFFLQVTIAAMLGVSSGAFLFLNRGDDGGEPQDPARA